VLDTKPPKYLEMAQGHISLSVMLLSREVLPDFAILSFSMCFISFVGRVFGNIHCVGSVECYSWYQRNRL
jgi:hypothetical protein